MCGSKVINGWEFTAELIIAKEPSASALNGGRVTFFVMYQGGDMAALYSDGMWYMTTENNELAEIAMRYFLDKYGG